MACHHERTVRWEVNRLERVLPDPAKVVLLKGSAYVMAQLPPARGRLYSDVDLLVPRADLPAIESSLLGNGWEPLKLLPYDQRYYRTWMHELPPLRHRERGTVVDVHHAILPESGRLHPDSASLLERAVGVRGSPFKVLAPADMVLHSAAHMFQDGQLAGAIRDLTDLDDLLRLFGGQNRFWEEIVPRAERLELGRPLFYALRYATSLLGTPVPAAVDIDSRRFAPVSVSLRVMDRLVGHALRPFHPDESSWRAEIASFLLYVRSHWLRMPPLLLLRHLTTKFLLRTSLLRHRDHG
jgi:hypothetical protein